MPLSPFVTRVLEEQEALVIALEDPSVIEAAKRVAFYAAMIDAAIDSPMDDEVEQNEALEHFQGKLTEHVENYQQLVNNLL